MYSVGYLGPKGTYTEKAAQKMFSDKENKIEPFKSIPEIFQGLKDGILDRGVVPIENSIEGSVNLTLDLLAQEEGIKITGEVIFPIEHALLARNGTAIEDITKIISHGQALAQCRVFFDNKIPRASLLETFSTAEAAAQVAKSNEPWAAVGHSELADIYGLTVLKQDIANCKTNKTRFIVLGTTGQKVSNPNKTSLLISITDRPGGLYQVLKEFALRNINLSKIESRPMKNGLGNYLFYIDFSGHPGERPVADCLSQIKEICAGFRILGFYRAAVQLDETVPGRRNLSLNQLRDEIDIIDRQIVELLAKRTELVNMVGEMKSPEVQVRDKSRELQILKRLTGEAKVKGVSPVLIKKLYGLLFDYFVDLQETKRKRKVLGYKGRPKNFKK